MNRVATASFLCNRCKHVMCEDCISIAEEYQQLDQIRKSSMIRMEEELRQVKAELEQLTRRAAMYQEVAQAGLPDIIGAWIDKEIDQLLAQGKPEIQTKGKRKNDR